MCCFGVRPQRWGDALSYLLLLIIKMTWVISPTENCILMLTADVVLRQAPMELIAVEEDP